MNRNDLNPPRTLRAQEMGRARPTLRAMRFTSEAELTRYFMKLIASRFVIILLAAYWSATTPRATCAQTRATNRQVSAMTDQGWPRKFTSGADSFSVYQPQTELWQGNRFEARAAVAVADAQTGQTTYGVIWFAARTEIDKVSRLVTMADFQITKVNST